MFKKCTLKGSRPPKEEIIQILLTSLRTTRVYAFFDAMDECDSAYHDEILSLFRDLLSFGSRLLISSRPHLTKLQDTLIAAQTINITASDADLQSYILARLKEEKNKDSELERRCLNLVEGIQGVYNSQSL